MCWGRSAHATLLLQESFNYSNGPIAAVSGGLWGTHSGTAGQIEVIDGRADLRVPATEDVSISIPGQPYTAASSTILYLSFTVNFSTLPSAGGQYFAHLKGAGTSNFRAKVFGLAAGVGTGQFHLGLANQANAVAATNDTVLNLNTDYRVYLRYVASNGVATLWIEPDAETSPAITGTDATSGANITSFALRQDSGIGVIAFDELRIGTTFAEVYTGPNIIPPGFTQQPVSTAAVEGGEATFVAVASGTAPLSYQWKFNDAQIPGATNAALTLTGVTTNAAGNYSLTVTNAGGATNSAVAKLTVIQPNASGTLTLVHHNVKGNFTSDWSTNAPQVQAIARQLQYLTPDIITLNEIPNGLRYEMTNWMTAFFPAYQLAVSLGTDGALRSGVISRFPIVRSQSWLVDASLTNFGYSGTFVRDLFEAEIAVPGASETLHVFTAHLKSGSDAASQNQRAAECGAVSNFLVTVFLPTNGWKPFLLTGDLNEDIAIAMSQNQQPIQRLIAASTGLKLTTPLNPFTLARFTHSIQGALDARFDYVLPNGLLFSNVVVSQVFRSDKLTSPPPPLLTNDSVVASDHLPVQMIFNYPDPPLRATLNVSNQTVTLTWPALVGRNFMIQTSTNLATWTTAAASVPAVSAQPTWTTTATDAVQYYRVVRLP
jgi:endonuclease/exonuclease/phosphatase family metal-dependent hydrolase